MPPRAPLLRYGLEALRLWVLLPKSSRIPYEAGLAPRAPLLLYGLEALRLWVLLPKSSRIPYEAGLAPRAPLLRRCFMEYRAALPKTPERNVTFPPHPPN